VLRAGSMRTKEKTYRLYNCLRCAVQVLICRDCDHGNIYCAGECAQISRLESLRRAAKCYQSTHDGACQHARRQSVWRKTQTKIVTHQGSLAGTATLIVAAVLTQTTTEGTHVDISSIQPPPTLQGLPRARLSAAPTCAHARWHAHRITRSVHCCSFCWRALPAFAHFGSLRSGP
jgi:hypothetical protein